MAISVGSVYRAYRRSIPTGISVDRKVNAIESCSKVSQRWTSGNMRRCSNFKGQEEEEEEKEDFLFLS